MQRRDLLKFGAVAGLSGSGCATLLSNPGALASSEMNAFLGALDAGLANISARTTFESFFPSNPKPELAARIRHGEELTRKTLRSLLMVGTVGELKPEQQAHEGVQARLRGSMGEFDDAMFGMTELLEGLTPSERTNISKALQDDPNLGMRIMGTFDQEAAAMGVSMKQRTKLRSLSIQACARLRQSPDTAITEYAGKARKIAARHGARAELERQTAAALGNALLWQQTEAASVEQPSAGGPMDLSGRGQVPPQDPNWQPTRNIPPPSQCVTAKDCGPGFDCRDYKDLGDGKWSAGQCVAVTPQSKNKTSPGVLTAGGVILGVTATAALILIAAGQAVIAATVGAILGAIGLLVLLVGLIILATGN